MVNAISIIILAYLIGSIPTGYIFGRMLKGVDIRKFGSGNLGATNAFRVLGWLPGISVLILDILKGLFVVVVLDPNLFRIIAGIAAISGHNWTIFLKFKGGKGIATSLGVLLGLCIKSPYLWGIIGLSAFIWLAVFLISRIISLSSILASIALPVLMLAFRVDFEFIVFSLVLCVFSLWRHRENIKRLKNGTEPRLKTFSKNP